MSQLRYYTPGLSLVAFAILVLVFPRFFAIIAALFILMAGGMALYTGHLLKKTQSNPDYFAEWQFNNDFMGGRRVRIPVFWRFR